MERRKVYFVVNEIVNMNFTKASVVEKYYPVRYSLSEFVFRDTAIVNLEGQASGELRLTEAQMITDGEKFCP